jgi:MoxR-like ATPase
MSKQGYEKMTVKDLRVLVRERGLGRGVEVLHTPKEELVRALDTWTPINTSGAPVPKEPTKAAAVVEEPKAAARVKAAPKAGDDKEAKLVEAIRAIAGGAVQPLDEARVIELVKEHSKPVEFKRVSVNGAPEVELKEHTHPMFEKVLKKAALGMNVMLVGPAGTGKTHLAEQVARALGKTFTCNSCSAGMSESHIVGRTLPDADGNWSYQKAPFVETFVSGGVHLFDEIDAADPNLLVSINAAMANGVLSVPIANETFRKHEGTVIIAAANTFGTGANREYVGRNPLDASTRDRFAVSTIEIDYDNKLEHAIASQYLEDSDVCEKVLNTCWKIRSDIQSNGLRRLMSTRTIKAIALSVASGDKLEDVLDDYFVGWSDDELRRINRKK